MGFWVSKALRKDRKLTSGIVFGQADVSRGSSRDGRWEKPTLSMNERAGHLCNPNPWIEGVLRFLSMSVGCGRF
jgi:hypothetical protein